MFTKIAVQIVCLALVAVAAGCGSSDKKPDAPAAAAPPPAAAANGTVAVQEKEFSIGAEPAADKAGKVTFDVQNGGKIPHEFVVVKTDKKAGDLGASKADEKGNVGEIGDIAPGASKKLSLDLKPGHYALICNLPGHYKAGGGQGMYADFNVK